MEIIANQKHLSIMPE